MMIARQWRGMVRREHASDYLKLMREVAIPDYRGTDGNLAALCLSNVRGHVVEVTTLTLWRDIEAVRAFAGPEPARARYYDFDDAYLLWQEREVEHAEVMAADFSGQVTAAVPA